MRFMQNMNRKLRRPGCAKAICVALSVISFYVLSLSADLPSFRLLSLSESEKLILVSQIPGKQKFLLDASSAKITIDGKPAEYKALKAYSMVQLKMEAHKLSKLGIDLDGVATEIRVGSPEKAK